MAAPRVCSARELFTSFFRKVRTRPAPAPRRQPLRTRLFLETLEARLNPSPMDFAPTVTTNPSDQTVVAGGIASFMAAASDGSPTPTAVQWQVDSGAGFTDLADGGVYSGTGTTTLTITGAAADLNGDRFEAVFSNAAGLSATTQPAALTVDFVPTVTGDPQDQTIAAGGNATFTAAASDGNPTPTAVQWQVDRGTGFTDLADGGVYSGTSTTTLTITGAAADLSGTRYQAVFSNAAGLSATTLPATLTVDFAPTVTSSPSSRTVDAAQDVSFTAAARDGNPTPTTVQWQVDTGSGFTDLSDGGAYSGVATDTLTINSATFAMNGFQYQAVFSNAAGLSATSKAATLTVVDVAPTVIGEPQHQAVEVGEEATFTAAANDGIPTPTSVQWQVSTDGGKTFSDLSDGGFYEGADSTTATVGGVAATLTVSSVPRGYNGYQYRALFNNAAGLGVFTDPATLTVDFAPTLTTQPTDQVIDVGETATFSAQAANGNPTPTTVQWQVSTDGVAWTDLVDGGFYSGSTTATPVGGGVTGTAFGGGAFATTTGVTTTGVSTAGVSTTGVTTTGVSTTGVSTTGVGTIAGGMAGGVSATLTITGATRALNGYEYRAVFGNAAGLSAASDAATLTVGPLEITGVSSVDPTGAYDEGKIISIEVRFNGPAIVNTTHGTPTLALNSGGSASYESGSGTDTLTFTYSVRAGDTSSRLDYPATTALALNGGRISGEGKPDPARLTLPATGTSSLFNQDIVIDTTPPTAALTGAESGTIATNLVTLTATAEDNPGGSGLAGVQFQLSNDKGATWFNVGPPQTGPGPFQVTDTSPLPDGAYEARAQATDNAGNTGAHSPTDPYTFSTLVSSFDAVGSDGTNFTGSYPEGPLFLDAADNLYSSTNMGGPAGAGTAFEVVQGSGTITPLAFLPGGLTAGQQVVVDQNGDRFGTTSGGGAHGFGTVYEIPAGGNAAETLASFDGGNGKYPDGALVLDAGGNVLGCTFYGGVKDQGVVFRFSPADNSVTDLLSFDGPNGAYPFDGLIQDGGGNLFGTTGFGGDLYGSGGYQRFFGTGTVFELKAASDSFTVVTGEQPADAAPTVTVNPNSQSVDDGGEVSFTAAASHGNPVDTRLQWQVSTDNGISYSDLADGQGYSGVDEETLTIRDVTPGMNGSRYQAVFSNGADRSTPSESATLTVYVAPTVTTQPQAQDVPDGSTATFTAAASDGRPTPTTVQWQVSTDGGKTFEPLADGNGVSGSTTTTLQVTVSAADDGNQYQAVFSNASGLESKSRAATLTVAFAPVVQGNPTDQTVHEGDTVSFTATAEDGKPTPTRVQWEVSSDGGETYSDVSDGTDYSGATKATPIEGGVSATLTITGSADLNGNLYEARFFNDAGQEATTEPAPLTVHFAPTVTDNPEPQTTDAGGTASFTAAADDGNPKPTQVFWQVSSDAGKTFSNLSNGGAYGGVTTDTLTITGATASLNGDRYRAVFYTAAAVPDISITAAAELTVNVAPSVTGDPQDRTVGVGGTISFMAAAEDGNPTPTTVRWQVSRDGGQTFDDLGDGGPYSGTGTATLTITGAGADLNGSRYRAVFGNAADLRATSEAATLTVSVPLPIPSGDVTLASSGTTSLADVRPSANPSPADTPPGASFPLGFFDFTVQNLPVGGAGTVVLTLPPGVEANSYWMYNPTPDNPRPHWFDFTFDGRTGATFAADAQGRVVITLHFIDGQRGDGDLAANGVIMDPGAPALAAALTPNQAFVDRLYRDLLHRAAETDGLAGWSEALDRGWLNRVQVVQGIEASVEYCTDEAEAAYQTLLGRPADPLGLLGAVRFLAGGGTFALLEANLMGSAEYYVRRGGGSATGFLVAAFHDTLMAAPTAGQLLVGEQLLGDGLPRNLVAGLLLARVEAQAERVAGYYETFLHRVPDLPGWVGHTTALQRGLSDEAVLALILGSDEYFTAL